MTDVRSRMAFAACLLACGTGWMVLPYTPTDMPGEPFPGALPVLQQLFAWWPLGLPAAIAIALALPRLQPGDGGWPRTVKAARGLLRMLQWLLTLASVALTLFCLFETLTPRPY